MNILKQFGISDYEIIKNNSDKINKSSQISFSFLNNNFDSSSLSENNIENQNNFNIDKKNLIVFTDGSALNNGKKNAKAGCGIVFPNYPELTKSFPLKGSIQTNNRAEFSACIEAIKVSDIINPDKRLPLTICTDSELLINTVTKWMANWRKNNWRKSDGKEVLNLDLIKDLYDLTKKRVVHWRHVRAHTNNSDYYSKWNARADELAREASESR